jgi:drug/metabolite transporter (DMT)-like permease
MAWLSWALAAMVFMALGNLGMKAASARGLSPASVLFWVVLGELPLALAYGLVRSKGAGSGAGILWALGAGFFTTIALVLVNESFARGAKTALAIGIMNANFMVVALLAFILFREQLQPSKVVGLATTLAGLWLMAR